MAVISFTADESCDSIVVQMANPKRKKYIKNKAMLC
jgi:hypothetical protein